ncbi:MAG: hypothetical protein H7A25_10365 [Leptospiraceae bacterium]|nr:hypothetical protein [Leptospiraceae bacterium]
MTDKKSERLTIYFGDGANKTGEAFESLNISSEKASSSTNSLSVSISEGNSAVFHNTVMNPDKSLLISGKAVFILFSLMVSSFLLLLFVLPVLKRLKL